MNGMMQKKLATACMLLSLALLSLPAAAQEKRSPEVLDRLSTDAMAAAQAGDFDKAIRIWEDILPELSGEGRAGLHYNLALAFKKVGRLPEAWHHLTSYLESIEKEDRKAGKMLEKLERKLSKTHRRVALACDPEPATLYFGLEAAGTAYSCPITWWFIPGKQFVHVKKKGFTAQTAQYDVRERGEKGVWMVKLVELPKHGWLVVEGGAKSVQVFLDGMLEGVVPFKRKLKEGEYKLMVGKSGEMPWEKTVVVKAGQTTVESPPNAKAPAEIPVEPDPGVTRPAAAEEEPSHWAQWALVGGGLGVMALGATLQGIGNSRESDLWDEHHPGDLSDYDGSTAEYDKAAIEAQEAYDAAFEDDVQSVRTWSYVLYGVGGATAVAGAAWLIADATARPAKADTKIDVSPMMVPGGAGAVFGMEF